MERLDAHDVSAVASFVGELRDVDDPLAFSPRVLELLRGLIRGDEAGYSEIDHAERRFDLQVWRTDEEDGIELGESDDEERRLYWSLYDTHPVCSYRERTGEWTAPLAMSDIVSSDELHRTPLYDACWRGFVEHSFGFYHFGFGLPPRGAVTRMFGILRFDHPDFTERDRLVARVIQPHLERRATDVQAAARATAALVAVDEDEASDEARLVMLCSADGVIEFAAPSARRLLKRYVGIDNGRLPSGLLARPHLVLADGDGRLTMRVAPAGPVRIVLLDERDVRLERLTLREREILDRVAAGATNAQIARELEISSATVAKHLEHVFEKLGVRSRTAAAALLQP